MAGKHWNERKKLDLMSQDKNNFLHEQGKAKRHRGQSSNR